MLVRCSLALCEDGLELNTQQALTINFLQTKIDELCDMAVPLKDRVMQILNGEGGTSEQPLRTIAQRREAVRKALEQYGREGGNVKDRLWSR